MKKYRSILRSINQKDAKTKKSLKRIKWVCVDVRTGFITYTMKGKQRARKRTRRRRFVATKCTCHLASPRLTSQCLRNVLGSGSISTSMATKRFHISRIMFKTTAFTSASVTIKSPVHKNRKLNAFNCWRSCEDVSKLTTRNEMHVVRKRK